MDALSHSELETLERHLVELNPDGMTDTEVNDFLWFERDEIADLLGYRNADAMFNQDDDDWEDHARSVISENFPDVDDEKIDGYIEDEFIENTSDADIIKEFKEYLKNQEEED